MSRIPHWLTHDYTEEGLKAMRELGQKMGRAAAEKMHDKVVGVLNENASGASLMSWREHEIEVAKLKRKIERLQSELDCYRRAYPGWTYSPKTKCLYCNGDDEYSCWGSNLD